MDEDIQGLEQSDYHQLSQAQSHQNPGGLMLCLERNPNPNKEETMKLQTANGMATVTKVQPCTSKKTGKTVYLYTTGQGTFISKNKLQHGADVSHAPSDCFG